ncbi:hypothetical protein HK405_007582 [Cladochytrium tenue]|nr:hypothetical protein HK405_007582 [Cladochytrium tenue]
MQLAQYFTKLLIWRLRRSRADSPLAERLANLYSPVANFRVMLRYNGIPALVQWILHSEANPPPTPYLRLLYRLQNAANLMYYPLEHIYWLASHKVLRLSEQTVNAVGMWSCRFWAAYVMLYFLQLQQEAKILAARSTDLVARARRGEDREVLRTEHRTIAKEMDSLLLNALINTAYFPLTIHWSLPSSPLPDVAVGICGSIAAVAQTYAAWKAA